jgi:hypothetical protein
MIDKSNHRYSKRSKERGWNIFTEAFIENNGIVIKQTARSTRGHIVSPNSVALDMADFKDLLIALEINR